MTASVRSPAIVHTNPRRIHNPSPLLRGVPCDCCSVWRGGALLCMMLSPFYREGPNLRERPKFLREAPVFPRLSFQEFSLRSPLLSSRGRGLNDPGRRSDYGRRSPLHLLLPVLARKVLRPSHDDHYNRHHYLQTEIQENGHHGLSPEIAGDRKRKVNRGVQQDHHQEAAPGAVVHPGEDDAHCECRDHESRVEGGSIKGISGQPKREVPQSPKRREQEAGTQGAHSALQTGQDVSPPPYLLS